MYALDSQSQELWQQITAQVGCTGQKEITFDKFTECMQSILAK